MIKSEEENQFVYDLLRNTSGDHHGWIGLYQKADNKFYWLDSRPEEGNFKNWDKNEPNYVTTNEGCVHIVKGDGKWNDRKCYDKRLVAICQRPI